MGADRAGGVQKHGLEVIALVLKKRQRSPPLGRLQAPLGRLQPIDN